MTDTKERVRTWNSMRTWVDIHEVNGLDVMFGDATPIYGVNWAALGCVDTEKATNFLRELANAVELSKTLNREAAIAAQKAKWDKEEAKQ